MKIGKRQLGWYEHIVRMLSELLMRRTHEMGVKRKRRRKRPRKTLLQQIGGFGKTMEKIL